MFNKKLMLLLFLVPNNLKMQISYDYEEINDKNGKPLYNILGYDERFNNTISDNDILKLQEIKTNLIRKELLDILEKEDISMLVKLYIIEKYFIDEQNIFKNTIKPYDLTCGNLIHNYFDIWEKEELYCKDSHNSQDFNNTIL